VGNLVHFGMFFFGKSVENLVGRFFDVFRVSLKGSRKNEFWVWFWVAGLRKPMKIRRIPGESPIFQMVPRGKPNFSNGSP
jgi:hypothetical protein